MPKRHLEESWLTREKALTPEFSQILSQLLYSQPDLRPAVLKALRIMVDSNTALASAEDDSTSWNTTISPEEAGQNINFLRAQAESWLAVFFNVFGSVGDEGRGTVGGVISAWAAIAGEVVCSIFLTRCQLLSSTRK